MKQSWSQKITLSRLIAGLGVCGLFLASILLSGCQSQEQSALPPATQVAAAQPAPATAQPPLNNPAPPPTDKPTVAQPTQVPPTVAPTSVAPTQAQALQSAAANPNRKAVEVTVFHVNDVMGETDPCGWGVPKGGLARRATVIKQERETNAGLILVLDGGSSLTGSWIANKSDGQVMVEAMNAMGYDGLALGRMDLGIGLDKVLELEKQAKFPFLSANLVSNADDKPLFKAYTTFERNGVKVGIIGLSEPEILQAPGVNNKAKLVDAAKVVKQYVDELRPQVDLLVLLSHQGIDKDKELVQVVPGIDMVIGGNTRKLMREPEQVGNTLLMEQGYRGEWLGRFQVSYDTQGVPSGAKVDIISLDDEYADDPDIVEILDKWVKLYPSPTPPPTWTPDPNAPTPTPFPTVAPVKPTAVKK